MSPAAPVVRPATAADEPALRAMAREVVEAGDAFVYEDVEGVLGYWLGPGSRAFVCELEGQVLGTYAIKANQPGRGAHVANIGYMVAHAARGRGLGRLLGEHSLERARALGFRSVQFNFVVASNTSALKLWRALGFAVAGTLPRAFRHADGRLVDAHVMVRDL